MDSSSGPVMRYVKSKQLQHVSTRGLPVLASRSEHAGYLTHAWLPAAVTAVHDIA